MIWIGKWLRWTKGSRPTWKECSSSHKDISTSRTLGLLSSTQTIQFLRWNSFSLSQSLCVINGDQENLPSRVREAYSSVQTPHGLQSFPGSASHVAQHHRSPPVIGNTWCSPPSFATIPECVWDMHWVLEPHTAFHLWSTKKLCVRVYCGSNPVLPSPSPLWENFIFTITNAVFNEESLACQSN